MVFDQMEFYNVSEMEARPGLPGWILHRFPKAARQAVHEDAADLCRSVELRFWMEAQRHLKGAVYLMARTCDGEAAVYYGDYQQAQVIPLPKGVITPVEILFPQELEKLPAGRFPNRVCRIFINNRAQVSYIGKEWLACRPPRPEEKPGRTLVGFGSSITNGGLARSNTGCYLQLAGRRLGMDVRNLGLSGSCLAQPEMADFIADQVPGDVFLMELGANMLGRFTPADYAARGAYVLRRVSQAHPEAWVIALALYPSIYGGQDFDAYGRELEGVVKRLALPKVRFVDALALLPDWTGLTTDGLHPSDWGHMLIAENLAQFMRGLKTEK